MKILNLKLVILLEYQNIKTFLQKSMFQIGLKKFLGLKKVQNTVPWMDVNPYYLLEHFTKKNCKKQIKKSLQLKK